MLRLFRCLLLLHLNFNLHTIGTLFRSLMLFFPMLSRKKLTREVFQSNVEF